MIGIRTPRAVLLAALLPGAVSFAQTVSFSPATSVVVGGGPDSVAIGDLNGDGKPDLAVANFSSNNVSILLGTGGGSFVAAANLNVGSNPRSIAIGDLTGDGKPDLAVANYSSHNVSILRNDGTGAFDPAMNFALVSFFPESVAIGDLNGDGKLDLAVANRASHNVSILLNTGTGAGTVAFSAAMNFAVASFFPAYVAIGDLNGDGKLDLAVANLGSGNVSILLNASTGTGTVAFSAAMIFAVGFNALSVAIGDLNGDGKPDLAVADWGSNNVSILPGTGTGSLFGAAATFAVGMNPQSVAIGDLNGDGKLDLAVSNYFSDNVSILLGTGATGTGSLFGAATNFAAGTNPDSVAIGDLNGDGKLDLAVANPFSNTVSILRNTTLFDPSGSFGLATDFAVGSFPVSVAIGDLNGDGKPDLAVANASSNNPNNNVNYVSILLGTGAGAFGLATNFRVGTFPFSVAIADLNADGKLDLAVANDGSNNVSILLNTGGGAFSPATNFAVGTTPASVAIGDLNGDRKPDLAVANFNDNIVSILLGDGAGAFGLATDFAVGAGPFSVAIGDLNGDGKPDLAVANASDNNVSILLNTTPYGAAVSFSAATNSAVDSLPRSVAIGDLNGDGKPDLAVANDGSNNISILLNIGAGAFGAATNFAVGTTPTSVTIGDLNRDGKLDLAVANVNSNNVSILFGDGAGAFDAATNLAVGTKPFSIAIGGLNGDGKLDLAVANVGSDTVSILLQNQAPAITSAGRAKFRVGAAGLFTVTATGAPTPLLSETGALPTGVAFTDNGDGTATLSGTPAPDTGRIYNISFTASNGVGSDAVQNFTLTVNQAPAITSAPSTTFTVGTAGSFTVTATGFPTPRLSEVGKLPRGVTFTDNGDGTGTLSGTPAAGTGGVYIISFRAINGKGGKPARQTFTLTVN